MDQQEETMTKKAIKERAQDELMCALQTAFNEHTLNELRGEMDHQMTRIEKLFGYDPGSWIRGC